METEQGVRLDFHGAGDAEAAPLGPGSCRRRRGRRPRRSPLFPQRCFCRLKTRPRVGGCDVKMRRPWLKSAIRKRFLTPEVVAVLKNRVGRGRGWRGRRLSAASPEPLRPRLGAWPGTGSRAGVNPPRPPPGRALCGPWTRRVRDWPAGTGPAGGGRGWGPEGRERRPGRRAVAFPRRGNVLELDRLRAAQ